MAKIDFTYNITDALTPLDGRNKHKLTSLTPYFSEFALDKYRILVEIKYLQKLSEYKIIRKLTKAQLVFNQNDYKKIREIELKTNHDLKAVEEWIKRKLPDVSSMVHFGLTADDVNNLAYALMIKGSLRQVIIPELQKILTLLGSCAKKYKSLAMLSRTHGQPAVPTTVGKEFLVYYKRLKKQIKGLALSSSTSLTVNSVEGKLTGNVGNLNVHKFLYPKINWLKFSEEFVASLGLKPDLVTTQIEPYDSLISIFQKLLAINNILLGLSVDFWIYLSFGYFQQKVIKAEVGSTALPHKVNPIYFEGAEGGLGIANALFEFYCRKLSHSRLQRDLSDSTVRRSFGTAFGYSLLSYQSIVEALNRIEPDKEKIKKDLDTHWEVLSEAIQNFLRTKGYKDAYEKVKRLFRGRQMTKNDLLQCLKTLRFTVGKKERQLLMKLTPQKYTGYAEELVDKFI